MYLNFLLKWSRISARYKVTLTEKQRDTLNQIITSRKHRLDHIERAKIIILSSELKQDKPIGHELSISQNAVRKWRTRWLKDEERLLLIDKAEKRDNLRSETVRNTQ